MNTGTELSFQLGNYQKQVESRLKQLEQQNFVQRMWDRDGALWKQQGQSLPLGWLDVTDKMFAALPEIEEFNEQLKAEGFTHAVLLGMGGSSLAPYVMQKTFRASGAIRLTVLDSTDPEMVKKVDSEIPLEKTLFIVASKSGNTAEVMAFYHYFYGRVLSLRGEKAGENFIAITDEGSPLSKLAEEKKFRKTFINFSDIGGRFSALSYFGIVPAMLMGINVKAFLQRTKTMVAECGPDVPASQNPGVILGAAIAEMALKGCNKLTYLMPQELSSFGLWLEQLVAESTGKEGKGILPLNGAPLLDIDTYGKDRCFFSLSFLHEPDYVLNQKLKDFTFLNYPLINIQVRDVMDLGREFFRWEVATAVAGAILEMNPFDQPNVEESKKCSKKLLAKLEEDGRLPEVSTSLVDGTTRYYGVPKAEDAKVLMENFLGVSKPGDYIAIQAYLPEEPSVEQAFTSIQSTLQKNLRMAVSVQYGPRYLHSTGQYHKGGPANGYFIQFVSNSGTDVKIPEHAYTFGLLKKAQALGDMEALRKQKRKVIMIDIGEDHLAGLQRFSQLIETVHSHGKRVKEPEGSKEHNPTAA